jgi:cytochrome c-type biogenesis protein CcmH/NrfF
MIRARRLAAFVALLAGSVAVLWSLLVGPEAAPLERRAADVAASLRCPTCAGESAADSAAANARAMRAVIRERLAAGEDPDEVRGYFVERYGRWILLDPPPTGADRLLWLAPAAAGLVAAGLAGRVLLRRPDPPDVRRELEPELRTGQRRRLLPATAALALAGLAGLAVSSAATERPVTTPRADAPTPAASPGEQSVEEHRAALRARPQDPAAAFALGFALARAGRDAEAEVVLAELVREQPDHQEALLLLGTTERALGREQWRDTLSRFLAESPDHAAAAVVRRLLDAQP